MSTLLEVSDVSVSFDGFKAFNNLSIEIGPSELRAVMGTNGVDQTSLLKAISGRHPYAAGTLALDGTPLTHLTTYAAARAGIADVPQGREVCPLMTVLENLQTGFACLPLAKRSIPSRIFDIFPVLREMRNRRGDDLSGGQQQLAIARILISKPRVLLLDEPTEGIQPNIIKQIGQVIAGLRDEGQFAFILVEQFFDFAFGLADEFVALNRGPVVLRGAKATLSRERLLERVSI